jgi:hypothetical protein
MGLTGVLGKESFRDAGGLSERAKGLCALPRNFSTYWNVSTSVGSFVSTKCNLRQVRAYHELPPLREFWSCRPTCLRRLFGDVEVPLQGRRVVVRGARRRRVWRGRDGILRGAQRQRVRRQFTDKELFLQ